MAEVKAGDKVSLLYTGRLEDGTVFDATATHKQMAKDVICVGDIGNFMPTCRHLVFPSQSPRLL